MTEQRPSIGRIVHYRLSDQDVSDAFVAHGQTHSQSLRAGDVLPAIVVGVFAEYKSIDAPLVLDMTVFLPGGHTLWVEAVRELREGQADQHGFWCWPPRV